MKKRIIAILLGLCLLCSIAVIAEETASEEPEEAYDILAELTYAEVITPKGPLNIRRSAKTTAPIIGEVPNGSMLPILSEEKDWCRITFKGIEGYVTSKYLVFVKELPFEELVKDDYGPAVLSLKERLQDLGYFRKGTEKLDGAFTLTTEDRLKIFQETNGLEVTGIATPELQAFIFWGPAVKFGEALPTAFFVTPEGMTPTPAGVTPTPTPVTGFPPTIRP